jgi:hypothetical protein
MTYRHQAIGWAVLLLVGADATAQSVFRCTVEGKTVYQARPCAGGRELQVEKAPTKQDVEEAKARAEAEKLRAEAVSGRLEETQRDNAKKASGQAATNGRCNFLDRQRAQVNLRRDIQQQNSRVQKPAKSDTGPLPDMSAIEGEMRSLGCVM